MADVFKRPARRVDDAILFFRTGDVRVHPCLEQHPVGHDFLPMSRVVGKTLVSLDAIHPSDGLSENHSAKCRSLEDVEHAQEPYRIR